MIKIVVVRARLGNNIMLQLLAWYFEQLVYLASVFTSSLNTSTEHVISDENTVGFLTLLVTVCIYNNLIQCNRRIPGACYIIRKKKKIVYKIKENVQLF